LSYDKGGLYVWLEADGTVSDIEIDARPDRSVCCPMTRKPLLTA